MSQNSSPSLLDAHQIVKRAYEETDDAIRIKVASGVDFAVELAASDGDSVLAVGTSDGTTSGTQKVIRVDSNGRTDVLSNRTVVAVTPVVSNAVAYTANDQLGDLQTIASSVRTGVGTAVLESLVIVDKGKQKSALTVFFFDASPTIASVDNGALDITDAEMGKCIGHVNVATGDYADVANSSIATVKNIQITMKPASGTSIFAVAMTTGTPTYTSTGDLIFKYAFFQD